jgi:hypothetical protein
MRRGRSTHSTRLFGVWKDRRFQSGEEYIRALRSGDWDVIDG